MRAVSAACGRYPLALRVLHWLIALMLAGQLTLGFVAEYGTSKAQSKDVLAWHFALGVSIFLLVIVRLSLRLILPLPAHALHEPQGLRRARAMVHVSLYLLLLALPISGHIIWVWMGADRNWFSVFELPAFFAPPAEDETGRTVAWYVHVYGAWTLIALVSLHVAAVLRQRREGNYIGRRMGFGRVRRQSPTLTEDA